MARQPSSEGTIDPEVLATAGLLVVDMQNGFCHPDGEGDAPLHDDIERWPAARAEPTIPAAAQTSA